MLKTHLKVFLRWLHSFVLFPWFLFFLTHSVHFQHVFSVFSPISTPPHPSLLAAPPCHPSPGCPYPLHRSSCHLHTHAFQLCTFNFQVHSILSLSLTFLLGFFISRALESQHVQVQAHRRRVAEHSGQEHRFWSQAAWVHLLPTSLTYQLGDLGASSFNSLCLSVFIVKIGVIILRTLKSCENWVSYYTWRA